MKPVLILVVKNYTYFQIFSNNCPKPFKPVVLGVTFNIRKFARNEYKKPMERDF